jgi:hypothetical protein
MSEARIRRLWCIASLSSAVLLIGGLGAIGLDYAINGGIDFIDGHLTLAACANFVGVVLCVGCLSGWTKHPD